MKIKFNITVEYDALCLFREKPTLDIYYWFDNSLGMTGCIAELLKTDFGDVWYMASDPEGIFRFAIYVYDDDRETVYLSNIFVGKKYRKNGFGNIILNTADEVAKKLKANTICLKVKQDSFVHDWYGRHGYIDLSVDGEEPHFIWMSKSL